MPDNPPKPNRADYVYCAECQVHVPRKYLKPSDEDFFADDEPKTLCPAGHVIKVEAAS